VSVGLIMATRSTNVESDESTMSQNAVVSCNRRLLAPAIARTRLNIHLRSEDFVRIVLRGVYWSIGRDILAEQGTEGWGTRVIDRLAHDLQNEFPGIEGFSPRSLKYMRALAEAWPEEPIVQQLIAQLPWGHNVRVLDRIKDRPTREWYLRAALEHGWSQNVLVHMISGKLHDREGKALTNFKRNLPPPDSDMAQQILRDPYNFDFLTLADPFAERELERGLLIHLRDLLLELGRGFSFVGSQVPLVVDDHSFYVDLLFYHIRLHCYFVIELLCGRPHNSSSVAQPVMWRSAKQTAIFAPSVYLNAT
jgi:predicted nuclease of restriction endonuclease-like (RecB) superfamily